MREKGGISKVRKRSIRREKAARDEKMPDLALNEQLSQSVLRSLHSQICQQLNLRAMVLHLDEQGLLTRTENEQLRNELFTTEERKKKLMEWIPSKGSDALTRFIVCLRKSAEGTGTGHHELAKALEKQIRKVHKNRPNPQDDGLCPGSLPSFKGRSLQPILTICIAMTILALFLLLLYFGSPLSYFSHQRSWVLYSPSLPDYVSHFSGREEEINDIVHWLDPQNTAVRIVSIVGPPGFGKSSLAIQVGHEMIDRGVVVNYVNLDELTLEDLPGKIVVNAGITTKDGTFKRVQKWARNDINFPVLLILDNCDDVIYKQEDELLNFLKILRGSAAMNVIKFLLTTKHKINIVDDFEEYPLEEISFEASCKLLRGVAKREVDEQSCKGITQQTGHVPLALKVVAAILRTRTRNISEVVEKLESQLLQTLNPTDMDQRVNASLTVSYSYLSERQKKLGQYLSLFPGSFAGNDAYIILNDTLDANYQYQRIDLEINVLEQKSLLQSFGKGRYQFHRIIKIFFVTNCNNSEHRNRFWKNFRLHYADLLFNVSSEFRRDYKSALHTLDTEKHNLYYMLSDIQDMCLMDSEISLRVFETVNTALNKRFLNCRFSVNELLKLIITIRKCLEDILQNYFDITSGTHFSDYQFMRQVRRIMIILTALSAKHYILDGSTASLEFVKALIERLQGSITIPGATNIYYHLATHYHNVGELDKEKRCYERIILLANVTLGSCSYGSCDYTELTWIYYRLEKFKVAAHFAELDIKYRKDRMSVFVLIETLHLLHICYEMIGNHAEMKGTVNNILQVLPLLNDATLPEVYSYLNLLSDIASFLRKNEITEAARYIERKLILAIKEMNATDTRLESTFALQAGELAQRLYTVEEYSEAIDMGECALSYFNKISDVGSKIKLLIVLGLSNYYIGNANASKEHFEEAIKCSLSDLHLYSYEASTACRFIIIYMHKVHYDCMNILWTGFQQLGYAILRFVISNTVPTDSTNLTFSDDNEIASTDISVSSKHLEFFPPELTIPVRSLFTILFKASLELIKRVFASNTALYFINVTIIFVKAIYLFLLCLCFCCCCIYNPLLYIVKLLFLVITTCRRRFL